MSITVPIAIEDPINARILAISEDRIEGFVEDPFRIMADRSGVALPVVIERIRAMLAAGTIRRVRQTLLATNLADGALVAWQTPEDNLTAAFDWMSQRDPFSGHIVIRTTDQVTAGSAYRLWTTLKVPQGFSLDRHCGLLMRLTGTTAYRIMPAKALFTLGVGHVRRRGLEPGSKSEEPGSVQFPKVVELSELQWRVLTALKREFEVDEVREHPWAARAEDAGVPLATFLDVAAELDRRRVIGRFSTFLEHVKKLADGSQVTRYNALFHWAVPPGREIDAGRQVGRFHVMTHAYWREGGPEFRNVNIMGVAHGTDKQLVLDHKAAIDRHLAEVGIPVAYTNVFWGGRSEIKPSEISPLAYRQWCSRHGVEPDTMRG